MPETMKVEIPLLEPLLGTLSVDRRSHLPIMIL